MGHFYFVRHGQTIWNVENKICGATDIQLTELGHRQAEEAGREILRQKMQIDEILYSPLSRAAETARHISQVTGIPARMELRLKEQNFGKYESTPRNGTEFQRAKMDFVSSYEGGESMLRLCQRIYNLLDEIREESEERPIFWWRTTGFPGQCIPISMTCPTKPSLPLESKTVRSEGMIFPGKKLRNKNPRKEYKKSIKISEKN